MSVSNEFFNRWQTFSLNINVILKAIIVFSQLINLGSSTLRPSMHAVQSCLLGGRGGVREESVIGLCILPCPSQVGCRKYRDFFFLVVVDCMDLQSIKITCGMGGLPASPPP